MFRVDLRLRPDPASTQIAMSVPSALHYYEGSGRNWERAALIKARVCAGDRIAGTEFLAQLAPFVWRKYLDFVALADIHDMKRQIHAYRGHGAVAVEGHNIKLGHGGIREIEFFVQTQQLIAGGRNPALRGRETARDIRRAQRQWLDRPGDLRGTGSRVPVFARRRTPAADGGRRTNPYFAAAAREDCDRFARFFGLPVGRERAFAEVLLKHLRAVESHYARLFEQRAGLACAAARPCRSRPARRDARSETLDRLAELGFRQPSRSRPPTVRRWNAGSHRGLARRSSARAISPN